MFLNFLRQPIKAGRLLALPAFLIASATCTVKLSAQGQTGLVPGTRTTLDAHNCYPYEGRWSDRIDRALAQGLPVAIEQDLFWYTDPQTGSSRSVLAHTKPLHGDEPSLETYFFERIRPLVEAELNHPHYEQWPIITLNLDIKTEEPEHLRAIYRTLHKYRNWLTTAANIDDPATVQPLHPGPLLVLAGPSDNIERVFRREVPQGASLLVFGAVHTNASDASVKVRDLEDEVASNYRRWWNNPWSTVEAGGPSHAGTWTQEGESRLRMMVQQAHANGLWIRFYTLDGATPEQQKTEGWFKTYNFTSLDAAEQRWRAAVAAGVDYLATDQYELVGKITHSSSISITARPSAIPKQ